MPRRNLRKTSLASQGFMTGKQKKARNRRNKIKRISRRKNRRA